MSSVPAAPSRPVTGSADPVILADAARAAAWLAKHVELALTGVDLTPPQYRILGVLGEGASVPSALAERLAVRRPTVTAVVDGLLARGLVERSPHEGDRRRVTHGLTEEGRRVLGHADSAVQERLCAIAAHGAGDPTSMVGTLAAWRSTLRAYAESKAAESAVTTR
ncbi:MAG: MarR family winged helix-turn-helix transcriptional regulator [Acidimicrobiales bacterium]